MGLFLFAVGLFIFLSLLFSASPVSWVPFVPAAAHRSRELVMAVLGLVEAGIGVGLWAQSRLAWYGMFTYTIGGALWMSAGFLFSPPPDELPSAAMAAVPIVVSGALCVGLFFVTAPVFRGMGRIEKSP